MNPYTQFNQSNQYNQYNYSNPYNQYSSPSSGAKVQSLINHNYIFYHKNFAISYNIY
jgi:hypothetical protein